MLKPSTSYKIILILLICFYALCSCKTNKSLSANQSQNEIKGTPKILFLNYSIEETLNGKRTIQFISKKIVDGKLKPQKFESVENGSIDDLVFTEFDKKSNSLNEILIKNPLIKIFEYVDESKQFKTKTIKSDETQFSIRLQLKSNTKYITISNFDENTPLIKTQIN